YSVFLIVILNPNSTPFPYTTLFRSHRDHRHRHDDDGAHQDIGHGPAHETRDHIPDLADGAQRVVKNMLRRDVEEGEQQPDHEAEDRKSTRLNSSHDQISYAVFCLKK